MTKSVTGVDRALAKFRTAQLTTQIERNAVNHTEPAPVTADPYRLPGDTRALRGIPAIGRGVAGHIPGTRPDAITAP